MLTSGNSTKQAEWLVARYVPDLRRREPRNMGVVLKMGDHLLSRFLGERDTGRIDGRRVHAFVNSVDNYKAWVSYWQSVASGDGKDLLALTGQRGDDSYFLEYGGERVFGSERTDPNDMLDYLYSVLVEEMPEPDTLNVKQLSENVLAKAGVRERVTPDYRLSLSPTDSAFFDYKYQNGSLHLMKRVTLTYEDERSWTSAHAAAWDFEKAANHLNSDRGQLIAFVKARSADSELEAQMSLLDGLACVLDVGQVQQAASQLTELLGARF